MAAQRVADLVESWAPDCVLTTGDNNYPSGAAATIDANVGQYYSEFISPYHGAYGSGATVNHFFPVLGNHDWDTDSAKPYLDYFTLPGNERYYEVIVGDLHFFAIDSDPREPDGISSDSIQARWLRERLSRSPTAFQVVAMHHAPFSSGPHGSAGTMQWPYRAWGADLVVAGHDHGYERLEVDGLTYVVTGLGGAGIYEFGAPVAESVLRYNKTHGATFIDFDDTALRVAFVDVDREIIDVKTILAAP